MRYLYPVSDLHANWEALEAVIRQITAGKYDKAVRCGDLVGYAADPNLVVDWVRDNCAVVVPRRITTVSSAPVSMTCEWFNPVARQAALWTLEKPFTKENVDYTALLAKRSCDGGRFEVVPHCRLTMKTSMCWRLRRGGAGIRVPGKPAGIFRTHPCSGWIHLESFPEVETIGRVSAA